MSDTPYRVGDLATSPDFALPFPAGTVVTIQTYVGHDPDDKKMDMYPEGWPAVVAAAAGLVHQWFDPGGIEINHGAGWFTTYMHMDERAAVGTEVKQGDWVGRPDTIGTWAKHLHHEHLYRDPAKGGATDADEPDMVNPVIQGQGPLVLVAGKPIVMTSTNGEQDMDAGQLLDALETQRGQEILGKAAKAAVLPALNKDAGGTRRPLSVWLAGVPGYKQPKPYKHASSSSVRARVAARLRGRHAKTVASSPAEGGAA